MSCASIKTYFPSSRAVSCTSSRKATSAPTVQVAHELFQYASATRSDVGSDKISPVDAREPMSCRMGKIPSTTRSAPTITGGHRSSFLPSVLRQISSQVARRTSSIVIVSSWVNQLGMKLPGGGRSPSGSASLTHVAACKKAHAHIAKEGRVMALPLSLPPIWSTPMLEKLMAGLCRFEETREADLIGLVVVIAIPIAVLGIGYLIDGGM